MYGHQAEKWCKILYVVRDIPVRNRPSVLLHISIKKVSLCFRFLWWRSGGRVQTRGMCHWDCGVGQPELGRRPAQPSTRQRWGLRLHQRGGRILLWRTMRPRKEVHLWDFERWVDMVIGVLGREALPKVFPIYLGKVRAVSKVVQPCCTCFSLKYTCCLLNYHNLTPYHSISHIHPPPLLPHVKLVCGMYITPIAPVYYPHLVPDVIPDAYYPSDLAAEVLSPTDLRVTWSPSIYACDVTAYTITYSADGQPSQVMFLLLYWSVNFVLKETELYKSFCVTTMV